MFVAGVNTLHNRGVDAKPLTRRISHNESEHTIQAKLQLGTHMKNPTMSQNYTTNNCMVQYQCIDTYLFMDALCYVQGRNFFSWPHMLQLFITDKGYIYVVPMKWRSEVLLALKQFCKEVRIPNAIICDVAKEQTSQDI